MLILLQCCVLLAFFCCANAKSSERANLINVQVDRQFDLDSHMAIVKVSCKIRNIGDEPVEKYEFFMDPEENGKVSYMLGGTSKSQLKLLNRSTNAAAAGSSSAREEYSLRLSQALTPGAETTLFFKYVLFDSVHPFPTTIKQSDPAYVRIRFSPLLYSRYDTSSQSTTVALPSKSVLSYSKQPEPVDLYGTKLTYGPYKDRPVFSRYPCHIHYQNNRPFLKVKRLERQVKASHWTSVTVEDKVHLVHIGPNLSHGFSRLDYMQIGPKPTAVASFVTTLPASAENVFYRDQVGNISTSTMRLSGNALLLELTPRYPLFGGWQTTYKIGYDLPVSRYVRYRGNEYVMRVRILDHMMDDMEVEEMTLKIALPEHSRNITIKTPYPLEYHCDTVTMAYLDTIGRPTCTIHYRHLSNWHSQILEVYYTLDDFFILRKPLYASAVLFCLFLTAIVAVRLDFSIVQDKNYERKMRMLSKWKTTRDRLKDYDWTFLKIGKALKKFREDRNFQTLDDSKKRIDIELRAHLIEMKTFEDELSQSSKVYAEKLAAVSKSVSDLRDSFRACVQSAERLAAGKGSKQTYSAAEQSCLALVEQLSHKIINDFH